MDKNTYKVLKFYNSHSNESYSISTVAKWFTKLSTRDLQEIVDYLVNNGYLRIIQGNKYQATNKSKTYLSTENRKWLFANIVSILSLIVSILAFIRTL